MHWSVVFWVNLPIGAVSIAMFALFLNERVERREHRIDYLGGVLLIIGIGALMLALVQAVSLAAGEIGLLVAVGGAALTWLFIHEQRTAEPMIPLALWRRRVLGAGLGIVASVAGLGLSRALTRVVQKAASASAHPLTKRSTNAIRSAGANRAASDQVVAAVGWNR